MGIELERISRGIKMIFLLRIYIINHLKKNHILINGEFFFFI